MQTDGCVRCTNGFDLHLYVTIEFYILMLWIYQTTSGGAAADYAALQSGVVYLRCITDYRIGSFQAVLQFFKENVRKNQSFTAARRLRVRVYSLGFPSLVCFCKKVPRAPAKLGLLRNLGLCSLANDRVPAARAVKPPILCGTIQLAFAGRLLAHEPTLPAGS